MIVIRDLTTGEYDRVTAAEWAAIQAEDWGNCYEFVAID